jgi:hypothetical protein
MIRTTPGYPHYAVLWRGKRSRAYLMNPCLAVARRMRRLGHTVTVVRV